MRFNFADVLVIVYLIYGTLRGRARRLSRELPRAASVVLAFTTGFGLYRASEHMLSGLAQITRRTMGAGTFGIVVIGALFLKRQFRGQIRDWATERYTDENLQKKAGAAAGFIRTATISAFIFIFASFAPMDLVRRPFTEGSLFGRTIVKVVRPLYELSHSHHAATP